MLTWNNLSTWNSSFLDSSSIEINLKKPNEEEEPNTKKTKEEERRSGKRISEDEQRKRKTIWLEKKNIAQSEEEEQMPG